MSAYKKPSTWGLPDGMAESLGKAMEQKPKHNPLVDLMRSISRTAEEIADLEPDPNDWDGWVMYLLEELQLQASKDIKPAAFESMLETLKTSLAARIDGGKW